jgi:hypothetical protein
MSGDRTLTSASENDKLVGGKLNRNYIAYNPVKYRIRDVLS